MTFITPTILPFQEIGISSFLLTFSCNAFFGLTKNKNVSFHKFGFVLTSFCKTKHRFKELCTEFTKTINKKTMTTNK